jgi:hypothetical protein
VSPPTPNGRNSSATSSAARCPQESAGARSAHPASTSTAACGAACTGRIPLNGTVEIRDNLVARIDEAEREGWLGEVEGLQISLAGANDKLAQINRRSLTTVELGMPNR